MTSLSLGKVAPNAELNRSVAQEASSATASVAANLPPPPEGWWTEAPKNRWASISLDESGTQLIGEAGKGLHIKSPSGETLRFDNRQLTCFSVLPERDRIVVGDASGNVRVWDLRSQAAVSLVGKHPTAVESISFHPTAGLITGDRGGSIIRWDVDSGRVLGSWSSNSGPIQSVRWSSDGKHCGVLVGHWADEQPVKRFVKLSQSLQKQYVAILPASAAVTLQLDSIGWLSVSWDGVVTSIPKSNNTLYAAEQPLYILDKDLVSGIVLCEEATLPAFVAAFESQAPFAAPEQSSAFHSFETSDPTLP